MRPEQRIAHHDRLWAARLRTQGYADGYDGKAAASVDADYLVGWRQGRQQRHTETLGAAAEAMADVGAAATTTSEAIKRLAPYLNEEEGTDGRNHPQRLAPRRGARRHPGRHVPDCRRALRRGDTMTRDEALDQAFALFGLDEFQRIAAADILRDLEGESWPPAPDSKHEQKLMELGALVSESWEPPYPGGPLASRKAPE